MLRKTFASKNERTYIKQFDGLRFFAIIMVMMAHWLQWRIDRTVVSVFPFDLGVTLFFVLSGFLITNILIHNKSKYEKVNKPKKSLIISFYIRRFLRIFPIYYLTLLFLYLIDYKNMQEIFPWLVSYTLNIYQSLHNAYVGDFNHFWSLAVEEQFYLFWPWVIIFVPNKHLQKVMIGTIILSILTKTYIFIYELNWMANTYFTISCLGSLGLGALFAYWNSFKPKITQYFMKFYWIIIRIIVYFGLHYFMILNGMFWYKEIFDEFMFAIMAALIINYASKDRFKSIFKWVLEKKFVSYSGKISYGLYVFHFFIPSLYWYLAPKIGIEIQNKYLQFIAFYFLTFIMAFLSWNLIEKPINSLKKKFPYFKK